MPLGAELAPLTRGCWGSFTHMPRDRHSRYRLEFDHVYEYTFDPEEGQYIIRDLGHAYNFNQAELQRMNITLPESL